MKIKKINPIAKSLLLKDKLPSIEQKKKKKKTKTKKEAIDLMEIYRLLKRLI